MYRQVALVACFWLMGCTGFYVPSRGDTADLASVAGRMPDCLVKIAVVTPEHHFYGPAPVLHHLQNLKAVRLVKSGEHPDLVLLVKIGHHASASQALMLVTVLTFGIFPTYYIETRDLEVEVWRGEARLETYRYKRRVHVIAGLLGGLLSPLGNVEGNEGAGFGEGHTSLMGKEFVHDLAGSDLLACPGSIAPRPVP